MRAEAWPTCPFWIIKNRMILTHLAFRLYISQVNTYIEVISAEKVKGLHLQLLLLCPSFTLLLVT